MNDVGKISYKEFDRLQSIEQTKKTKRGSCHDQVWLECNELRRRGYDPKVKFLIEVDPNGRGGATHSFAYFNSDDGKVNWIENAWGGNKGIHGYDSYDHMMADVKSRWERNDKYPELLTGNLDYSKFNAGMDLGDIIDLVELDD